MKRILLFTIFVSLPILSYAALTPQSVIGAQQYDQKACIDRAANDCINNTCLTSDDLNCSAKCRASAENKCQVQAQQ